MSCTLHQSLIEMGSETLADLLLEIARDSESAHNKIMRLTSSKSQNVSLFRQKLKDLAENESRFVPWKYSSEFAEEVSDLLQDIKEGATTPQEGLGLVVEFFKADEKIFEMVDDSSGHVGDVFTSEAFDLFRHYANQIEDKAPIINTIIELLNEDNYGVRGPVLKYAYLFLNQQDLRRLFAKAEAKSKEFKGQHNPWAWQLASIANQMKDGPLFEKLTRKRSGGPVNDRTLVEIASVYFEGGDHERAQSLLDEISNDDPFARVDRLALQKRIFHKTDKTDELRELLTKAFKEHYSEDSLRELLVAVGADKREQFCREAIVDILSDTHWRPYHAKFLIYLEAFDEAEEYILKHARSSLNGDHYSSQLPMAKTMEESQKYLVASLIYRSLLDSILNRAKSKTYHHGARYYHKLEELSGKINDWSSVSTHSQYLQNLKQTHGKKWGFWKRVEA